MSNVHTLNFDQPYELQNQNTASPSLNQPGNNRRRNFGGGQSLGGQRAANPWANQNVHTHNQNGNREAAMHEISQLKSEDDEPELTRQYNGHMYDDFWTDQGNNQGGAEGMLARCGCGCCIGSPFSDVRKGDWKRLFMTFTLWVMIVDLIMLIIEIVVGKGMSTWRLAINGDWTLWKLGAKFYPSIYCQYQVFRYVTPIVLHAGLWHFLMNMWFTYSVMLRREVYWGVVRTAVMYVVSGVGGSIYSIVLYPLSMSVGASGALCGIYGGYVVDVVRMWKKMSSRQRISCVINILVFLGLMVLIGFFLMGGIDNGAHLGGLFTGIFLGMVLLQRNLIVRIVGGVLLAVLWVVPTVLMYVIAPPAYGCDV